MAAPRVYRLDVTYPEGSQEYGWEPDGWKQTARDPDTGALIPGQFEWPRVRLYLSRRGAEDRARVLRSYGATVQVVASDPVTFPEPPG